MGNKAGLWLAIATTLCLLSSHSLALDTQLALEQRICENLKLASTQVLDDTSDTTKYLSPYIAAELYQQVVQKSVLAAGEAGAETQAPAMAALSCTDTVSTFLMSIKKRMEFNRVDYFVARYRFWIIGALLLVLLGGFFYWRLNRPSTKVAE